MLQQVFRQGHTAIELCIKFSSAVFAHHRVRIFAVWQKQETYLPPLAQLWQCYLQCAPRRIAPGAVAVKAEYDLVGAAEQALEMVYLDKDGIKTARRILPLSMVFLDKNLICLAWCCLRQDYRRFHVSSMSEVRLTDESFRPRRVALLREFLEKTRG